MKGKKFLSLIVCLFLTFCIFVTSGCEKGDPKGSITIEYYALNSETATKSIKYDFKEEDTLKSIIIKKFNNVTFGTGSNSGMIFNIEDYVQPMNGTSPDWSSYIAFYIDNEYALTGVEDTPLIDGKTYSFKVTVYNF